MGPFKIFNLKYSYFSEWTVTGIGSDIVVIGIYIYIYIYAYV